MSKAKAPKTVDQSREQYGSVQASLQASSEQLYMLFSKCSPYRTLEQNRSSDLMPDLYLEVREDEVVAMTAEQPGVIESSHVFTEDYFTRVNLESDTPIGFVVPANAQRNRVNLLGDEVRITIQGPDDCRLGDRLVVTDGCITSWAVAPDEHESKVKSIYPAFAEGA